MSSFSARVAELILDKFNAAGGAPPDVRSFVEHIECATTGRLYADLVPEADRPPTAIGCCYGSAVYGPERCTCWVPVFDVAQADPVPPATPADLEVQPSMCGDCAFRKGSPERADPFSEEVLLDLAAKGEPFWCHAGMRRPVLYRHPQLGDIPGEPADWSPPIVNGMPFRVDGRPGLLCAGWMNRRRHAV